MHAIAERIARDHLRLVRIKDDFIAAACPFHKGGQERHASFWVDKNSGSWGCFTCPERGKSLKELLRKMGLRKSKIEAEIDEAVEEAKHEESINRMRRKKKSRAQFKGEYIIPEALLGVFDYAPVSLIEAGFTKDTLRYHDIGFDKRMNRITFPIRDVFGNLIGISGRSVDRQLPKYKVYEGTREVEGKVVKGELSEYLEGYSSRGIRDHLWRGNFVYRDLYHGRSEQLIVVEGYKAAMWLVQHGWYNTVALMGSRMSKTQERLIMRMGTETWVLLDNNEPGRMGSIQVCDRIARGTFPVYECHYPGYCDEETQPDDLNEDELDEVLATAPRIGGKFYGYFKKHTQA